jgi:hypothetical protein
MEIKAEVSHREDNPMLEQRKNERIEVNKVIVSLPNVVCQVINVNQGGISFRCRGEHDFPNEVSIGVYDSTGVSMEKLHVKKIWEKRSHRPNTQAPFVMAVGWEFSNLTFSQKSHLKLYLQQLEEADRRRS